MHCTVGDVDAVRFERRSMVDSMKVVVSKTRKEQSRSFEGMLRACWWNRESG